MSAMDPHGIRKNVGGLAVRQAVLSDLEALVPLFDGYRQFYGRPTDIGAAREFLLARFDHAESFLFIAFEGDAAIGFVQLYPSFSSVSLARTLILNDLFVREGARRKGVASRLISAAVEFARTLGAVRISLSTATSNETAQALYKAAGWKRDEQFFVYHFAI
jgi:ribosomal protein S18 acetylase RimI-like enzyme